MQTLTPSLLAGLQASLAARSVEVFHEPTLRLAGVLVLLDGTGDDLTVTLTRRTSRVEHHKGEISFPGGAWDVTDKDLMATALRETHEEVGIAPERVRVLGALPQVVVPRSSYLISPYVGSLDAEPTFTPNAAEVDEILRVPLAFFFDTQHRTEEPENPDRPLHPVTLRSYPQPTYSYQFGQHRIWGATARILTGLVALLAEDPRRAEVLHKEEPWTRLTARSRP